MDPVPLFFDHGSGSHLFDVDGNDYVDYVLGMGPGIIGHAPPEVVEAVREAVGRGQLFAGQTRAELELAERFQAMVPCAERVRFGSSGTEMDQAAIRLARAATGRPGHPQVRGPLPRLARSAPHERRPAPRPRGPAGRADAAPPERRPGRELGGRTSRSCQWNDTDGVRRLLTGPDRERIAAVIMEPILCNTSVIPPAPGFLETVRELTAANGTVLIFDEVITGFRVGPGGAQRRLGVTPDLAVFAKAMASGYPDRRPRRPARPHGADRQGRAPRRHLQRERRRASQPRTRPSPSSRRAATSSTSGSSWPASG